MRNTIKSLLCIIVCTLWLGNFLQAQAQAQPQLEKLAEEQIDQSDLEYAKDLADQILGKWAEGSYYQFSEEEAIPQVAQAFTEDMQKTQYQQIKGQFGNYDASLDYEEAYSFSQGTMEGTIYRFKGDFTDSDPEVRIVVTEDNKLAGMFIMPWNDSLQ